MDILGSLHSPTLPFDEWLAAAWGQENGKGTSSPNWLGQQTACIRVTDLPDPGAWAPLDGVQHCYREVYAPLSAQFPTATKN